MLIFFLIVVILLFLPCRLSLLSDNQKGSFRLIVFLHLIFFKIRLYDRLLQIGKKKKIKRKDRNIKWLFKALGIKRFALDARIGTGDAAQTALLAGLLNIAVSSLLQPLSLAFGSFDAKPKLNILPDFNEKCFSFSIECITVISLGKIIIAYLKRLYVNRQKNLYAAKESTI